METFGTKMSV